MISKSPDRNSFQINCIKEKQDCSVELDFYLNRKNIKDQQEQDKEWQKDNLEFDLRSTDWICKKTCESDSYAQNLYAALCNNGFIKKELWNLIKGDEWHSSWRHAGGIVADMRGTGDYIDWYCSGIKDEYASNKGYVGEGDVTEEVKNDINKLGWMIVPYEEKN